MYIAQADLEFRILLPQPPVCWVAYVCSHAWFQMVSSAFQGNIFGPNKSNLLKFVLKLSNLLQTKDQFLTEPLGWLLNKCVNNLLLPQISKAMFVLPNDLCEILMVDVKDKNKEPTVVVSNPNNTDLLKEAYIYWSYNGNTQKELKNIYKHNILESSQFF